MAGEVVAEGEGERCVRAAAVLVLLAGGERCAVPQPAQASRTQAARAAITPIRPERGAVTGTDDRGPLATLL